MSYQHTLLYYIQLENFVVVFTCNFVLARESSLKLLLPFYSPLILLTTIKFCFLIDPYSIVEIPTFL